MENRMAAMFNKDQNEDPMAMKAKIQDKYLKTKEGLQIDTWSAFGKMTYLEVAVEDLEASRTKCCKFTETTNKRNR